MTGMSEGLIPTSAADADSATTTERQHGSRDWPAIFERLSEADRAGRLPGDELESLATAAFFAGRADEALEIQERAFTAHKEAGNDLRAAYLALDIGRNYGHSGKNAIAAAWTRRAEHIIGQDGETYAHGYLALIRSETARTTGDFDAALRQAEHAVDIGEGADDADLRAHALANLGELKIASGSPSEGFAMIEEASIAALNGELTPITSGITTCRMIGACRDMTDYRRASEWIEATEKYCEMHSLSGFPGVCRIHRAEVTAVGGGWDRAEQELQRATVELTGFNATPPQADGFYAIGDIRRLRGDFDGAEAALRDAHSRGRTPQPALALIRLAQGKIEAAASSIDAALAEQTWDRWARARLLPAQIEIAIAAGRVAVARTAVDELNETVPGYPSPALEAGRRSALARVLLAEGDARGAAREVREAMKDWREVGAPYELARARLILSRALRELEDEDDADLELQAAHDTFTTLGAKVDVEAVEREQREIEDRRSSPVTVRMTFMFTDIVGSTNMAEALGDQAWEILLRWHDDILKGLISKAGGQIVNSTGDGFFAAFDAAPDAVACAISIQRALSEYRDSTGFALSVRIGLHTADANRRGSDYSGKGVHVAARVGALATSGEILATADTLAESGEVAASALRATAIRGVSMTVDLASVTWS
jgi:class 3 adenylate cyclase